MDMNNTTCIAHNGSYCCTRPEGHSGRHWTATEAATDSSGRRYSRRYWFNTQYTEVHEQRFA